MGQPVSQVDVPALHKIGRGTVAAGDTFDDIQAAHTPNLATGTRIEEWATGSALTAAAAAWTAFAQQLAGQAQGLGADLSEAARAYEASDTAAAARTGQIPSGHPVIGRGYGYGPA